MTTQHAGRLITLRSTRARTALLALAAVVTLAMASLTAAPSQAAPSHRSVTYVWEGVEISYGVQSINGGPCINSDMGDWDAAVGCYKEDGDKWKIMDGGQDGERVGLEWKVTDGSAAGRWGICGNAGGSGNIGECNKDYPEGSHLIFRVARCDGDVNPCAKPGTGSGWNHWSAWIGTSA